mmetsp:Transcript_8631/g.15303  ORF Transcript_8631/g.15303 Transcript_8631/m.15303 type:complete len:202 (+) Transcript_8631:596-1201(+)
MLGTFVRQFSSTLIFLPLSSICTPAASSPKLSKNWRRPTQTRTTSDSWLEESPPAAASVLTFTVLPVFSTPVTLVFIWKPMPCFFKRAINCLATSASIPKPPMESMNSTTVTLLPNRLHTEPSSKPMTPPPITVSRSGTCFSFRAPVLETMTSSSSSMPGKLITSEPVANMMFFASMLCSPPSRRSTLREVGPVSVPWPLT